MELCCFILGLSKKSESLKVYLSEIFVRKSEWEWAHITAKNLNTKVCARAVWNKLGRGESRSSHKRYQLRLRQFWELDVIFSPCENSDVRSLFCNTTSLHTFWVMHHEPRFSIVSAMPPYMQWTLTFLMEKLTFCKRQKDVKNYRFKQ